MLWLDTSTRFAPFGELPEQARGREAWLFPEPGRALAKTTTPATGAVSPKQVDLKLELSPEGVLSGEGVERFAGFEAAQLSEALENLSPISASRRSRARCRGSTAARSCRSWI